MPALHENLRKQLEKVIIAARDKAEAAARAALQRLAVDQPEPFKHQTADLRSLRNQLRARARQLGDLLEQKKQAIDHLTHELAYEHWHRMLFARFLAENGLLIHPDLAVPVTLAECQDLAKEEAADTNTKPDAWALAGRFASGMLPQIFRADDPLLQVTLAPEDQLALEKLLVSLPGGEHGVFTADDSLGWVYQFWQSKHKAEANASGEKVTGDTLPAVTQLFTEHYMVLFLLHNTVGAWHAGKALAANPILAASAASEEELRKAVALKSAGGYSFEYLRFVRGTDGTSGPWRPAAGSFARWPQHARELKTLDPCCGSGHFLIALFDLLIRLRMEEEGLTVAEAADAVLRDNVHGLELDLRCTQIAAFNLAVAVWKLSSYRPLPSLSIACTGIVPRTSLEKWLTQTDKVPLRDRGPIKLGLRALHDAFADASTLGSLIDPNRLNIVGAADYETLAPVLLEALKLETTDDQHADAVTAHGLLRAAELLAGPAQGYTLVITNVPYLGDDDFGPALSAHAVTFEDDAKTDLATVFCSRAERWCSRHGTMAVVTPQNWLFLVSYKHFRQRLLRTCSWNAVAKLGEHAFESPAAAGAYAAMVVISRGEAEEGHTFCEFDVSAPRGQKPIYTAEKARLLPVKGSVILDQAAQLRNPDARIGAAAKSDLVLLDDCATNHQGLSTGDNPRFRRSHWEVPRFGSVWAPEQSSVLSTCNFGGRSGILQWEQGKGQLYRFGRENVDRLHNVDRRGEEAWGRHGVGVRQMGTLPVTLFTGEHFDTSVAVILPRKDEDFAAIWMFCESPEYAQAIRAANPKVNVDNGYLTKVLFDLAYWKQVASQKYPSGLPEPECNDPTQWLFHGRPEASESPLQVALARLVGYRWPAELDETMRLSRQARTLVKRCDELLPMADEDGIVCIPSIRGEEKAAERLLAMIAACGVKADRDLDGYLRNTFFEEHFKLFQHRPFVWHIWDGKKDGFHALVNYHKLADGKRGKKLLETLTYSYLGDWISRQKADVKAERAGAEARLVAALELQKKLAAIAVGEPPFDIFVRWKPLHEQPVGWEPDLNDGVRMNIRPFVEAGILRRTPNINWTKDRGKDPETAPWFKVFRGERINDHHLTNAEKLAAREAHQAKEAKSASSGRKG